MQSWKFIRVHDDVYEDLKALGEYGDSFSDIIRRLILDRMASDRHNNTGGKPKELPRDEVKARMKKFGSHTRAISRLVKENVSYSPESVREAADK